MEKKEYNIPKVRVVNMETIYMLAATNREFLGSFGSSDSRRQNVWEDEEAEEEETMWK